MRLHEPISVVVMMLVDVIECFHCFHREVTSALWHVNVNRWKCVVFVAARKQHFIAVTCPRGLHVTRFGVHGLF